MEISEPAPEFCLTPGNGGRILAQSPVAAGILPAEEPGVPPGGLVGTQAETTSARPRWALLRHDRAAGGTPAATSHLARQSGAVSGCAHQSRLSGRIQDMKEEAY